MVATKLGFSGRVAVVTGAGGGLGRAYALELARRGASVVVNDLGGSFHGEGKGTQLADQVVKEILDAGGKAVPNYDSVENGEKIIHTALESFGKIDILINNAGILRDKSFAKMSEQDWSKVLQVHLHGAFKVTKAAWPHMQKHKYGRIIMTTSPSGLYGNFGQTNYSAAKMALVGFANSLSIEGKKKNILVNTIAPVAETRMTADIMPEVGFLPKFVAPFVLYMCHESFKETGIILESAGGYACRTRLHRTEGLQLRQYVSDNPTVECVAESWDRITNFGDTSNFTVGGSSEVAMESISKLQEKPLPTNATAAEKMLAYVSPPNKTIVTRDQAILYSLAIGADLPGDFRYLYEGHEEFAAFPTFAAVVGMSMGSLVNVPGMEEVNISNVVHGEQYTEVFQPLPVEGKVTTTTKIVDVLDKKRFCQIISEMETFNDKGEKVARNQFVALFLGTSGVGRKGRSTLQVPSIRPPDRKPDFVSEEKTNTNQAALYRLCGDKNPLHIDPGFAQAVGFSQPILHGLCSYGFAVRHVLKRYGNNDPSYFKSVKAQFSKPVIPGQTLVTEMWCEGRRIHFQTKVKETNDVVIKGAYVDFNKDPLVSENSSSEANVESQTPSSAVNNSLKAAALFQEVKERLKVTPDLVSNIKASFLWQITLDKKIAGEWLLDLKSSPPSVVYGPSKVKADVTIQMEDSVFEQLARGKLNPVNAFMEGKLKATGKIMLAQKLGDIFKSHAKL